MIAQFLEAYVQTASHAKDFCKTEGVDLVCQLAVLPCIPPNFEDTPACTSLTTFLKSLGDTTPAPLLTGLVKLVQSTLQQVRFMWDTSDVESQLGGLLSPTDEDQMKTANQNCSALASFQIACTLLEVVFPHLAFTHSRGTITQALQIISGVSETPDGSPPYDINLLQVLGKMHRTCMREHVMLKLQCSENENEASTSAQVSDDSKTTETSAPPVSPALGLAGVIAPQPSASQKSKHNWTLVKEILASIIASLEGILTAVVSRPQPRRNPDAPFHSQAVSTSQTIATVMADYLDVKPSGRHLLDALTVYG